ncbi:MAG: DUF72 domain-containing protein [Candidatus Rokubacteria bacterium]|nr:DUF72 domain-containing protein [Candidatus Rokubacteria bacterium]
MVIRVGCCGWPVARPRYFATFALVEVQESFYNLPRLATVERWRAAAPAAFEFVLKAPQLITHEPTSPTYRRLRIPLTGAARKRYGAFRPTREVRAAWAETLALARALRSKIVVFQCPASFTPTAAHIRDLTRFFEKVERDGLAFAWEPRGQWPDAEVQTLCRRAHLIHCVDPLLRRPVWGEPAYFRLHGKGGYHYQYSEAELGELRALARAFSEVYVLFNNTAMFDDARRFLKLLE